MKAEIKEVNKFSLKRDIIFKEDNSTRRCKICKIIVHRATYAKYLGSKKHIKNDIMIPDWFFQDLFENKPEKNT